MTSLKVLRAINKDKWQFLGTIKTIHSTHWHALLSIYMVIASTSQYKNTKSWRFHLKYSHTAVATGKLKKRKKCAGGGVLSREILFS